MLGLWQAWTSGYLVLVQQSDQQRPATTTTTTSTSADSASGHIRSAHRTHASRGHHCIQLAAATTTTTTTTSVSVSTGTTSSTLYYISVICDESVRTRTSHLRHQLHQQHVRLRGRTTTRHRRISSLLRHQPAESRTSSRSTSRVTSTLGNTLRHRCCYVGCTVQLAPRNFADHVPLQPHYTQHSLSTATNQPIHNYGYKDILLICKNIYFPVRLCICDVRAPPLGLHDIFDSGIILHINSKDSSTIVHQGEIEYLYHHRSHLFIDAMAFNIDHKIHQHWAHYIQQHGFDSDRCILMNGIDEHQHPRSSKIQKELTAAKFFSFWAFFLQKNLASVFFPRICSI